MKPEEKAKLAQGLAFGSLLCAWFTGIPALLLALSAMKSLQKGSDAYRRARLAMVISVSLCGVWLIAAAVSVAVSPTASPGSRSSSSEELRRGVFYVILSGSTWVYGEPGQPRAKRVLGQGTIVAIGEMRTIDGKLWVNLEYATRTDPKSLMEETDTGWVMEPKLREATDQELGIKKR